MTENTETEAPVEEAIEVALPDETLNAFRSRHIRIVEPGWEGYTGDFGMTRFVDGVSEHPVQWQEQQRLGAGIRMETADADEQGQQIGPSSELVRNKGLTTDDAIVAAVDSAVIGITGEVRLVAEAFTREQLEDVADKHGIAGLREIAKRWGVKHSSVLGLIKEILEAQGGAA